MVLIKNSGKSRTKVPLKYEMSVLIEGRSNCTCLRKPAGALLVDGLPTDRVLI